MAVEYHLLTAFGTGKTVTMTIASPCVITYTAHGLSDGFKVVFSTTGALPTGVTAGTTYYAKSIAADTFSLYTDAALTNIVNTSGSQSGTHTIYSEYWYNLPVTDPGGGGNYRARYGASGSERVHATWYDFTVYASTVANKSMTIDRYVEIQGKWTDTAISTLNFYSGYQKITVATRIMGARSDAFHGGVVGGGYANVISQGGRSIFNCNIPRCVVDGVEARTTSVNGGATIVVGAGGSVINCICTAPLTIPNLGLLANNIVLSLGGSEKGIQDQDSSYGVAAFNLVHGAAIGFYCGDATDARALNSYYIGNIAIGNTVNYKIPKSTNFTTARFQAHHNFGDSTDIRIVTFEDSATSGTLTVRFTAHGYPLNYPIRFSNGGGAVAPTGISFETVYYIKAVATDTFTLSATVGGTAIAYTDSGSGTITTSLVWDTSNTDGVITSSDFVNYAAHDFMPASASSPQVDLISLTAEDVFPYYDIADAVRPNYESATYPDNLADAGPFEFDHGNGLAPLSVPISITGMASGSEFAVYKASDMSEIVAPSSTTGSYSGTYAYTGDTNIVVRVRKGSAATKYLPYEYAGTITSTGFALVVSQIPDPIA